MRINQRDLNRLKRMLERMAATESRRIVQFGQHKKGSARASEIADAKALSMAIAILELMQ